MENLKNLWVNLSRNPFKRKGYTFYKGFWRNIYIGEGAGTKGVWIKPHWKVKKYGHRKEGEKQMQDIIDKLELNHPTSP
tara:strand:- start:628 stop:864 length:237 start_codon:yes stop_codon:yes gene_type:complete